MNHQQLKYAGIGLIAVALAVVVVGLVLKNRREPQIRSYHDAVELAERGAERGRDSTIQVDSDSGKVRSGNTAPADAAGIDEDGYLVDEDGERIVDEEGNPFLAADFVAAGGELPPGVLLANATTGGASGGGSAERQSPGTPGTAASGTPATSGGAIDSADSGSDRETNIDSDDDEMDGQGIHVAGSVFRGEDPVPNAALTLIGPAGNLNARTTDTGRFSFPPVSPGDYTLMLVSPSSPASRRRMALVEGQDRLNEDFVIPGLPPMEGIVVSAASGESIASAMVEVWQGNSLVGSVSAKTNGEFRLFPLDAGAYLAKGAADGYLPGEQPFEVSADGRNSRIILELPESAVVLGQVVDANGTPVAQARVGLFSGAAYNDPFGALGDKLSDGAGRFRFALPAQASQGTFRVGAYREGHVPAYSEMQSAQDLPDLITVRLGQGGSIAGRIVDSESDPVSFAEITVDNPYASVGAIVQRFHLPPMTISPQENGYFQIDALEPGPAALAVAADGFTPQKPEFQVTDGQINDVGDIVLESEDAKPGRIAGLVVDEQGRPMEGHNVYIRGEEERHTKTDSRGGFVADDLPEGEYVIFTNGSVLRGDLFIAMDQTYPFARPGEDRIYLLYDLAQAIRFRALDSAGEPIKNVDVAVEVRYNGAAGHQDVRETFGLGYKESIQTSSGEVLVDNILAGTANLTIKADGVGSEKITDINVPVGDEINLGDITIAEGADMEGRVVSAIDGSAVSGVLVEAAAPQGASGNHPLYSLKVQTRTGMGGDFLLKGVPEGPLDLVFTKTGWATHRETDLEAYANQGNVIGSVALEPEAVLRGYVTGADGLPIYNVIINVQGQTGFTDREGNFRMGQLSQGDATILATDQTEGHKRYRASVELLAAKEVVHDFQMQK